MATRTMTDIYQERYIAHQLRKKDSLTKLMKKRYSERIFSDKEVPMKHIRRIIKAMQLCPSSCNRKAIYGEVIFDRDDKALLGGLLVGGVGWIHRAPAILLFFADKKAYKAKGELDYMPYLDAGIAIEHAWLMATALNLKSAFVNPNIRTRNEKHFEKVFGKGLFCGALAFGYKDELL